MRRPHSSSHRLWRGCLTDNWDLPENYYDVVVTAEVLEHLYYPDKVIQKIKKCLKPGGILIGSIPNAFSLKNRVRYLCGKRKYTPLSDPTHITQFNEKDIKEILEKHFNQINITGTGKLKKFASLKPSWFAFTLFFIAK